MKIPIVNERDEVMGMEDRSIIHRDGLKHREIHVWLVTSDKKFIFQKRGLHQDTWPGFFDVTCGGHIDEPNESYEQAAERELFEETGIHVPLTFIMKKYSETFDPNTQTHNHAFRVTFAGLYNQGINNLKIEDGHGQGFKFFSLNEIKNFTDEQRKEYIPRFLYENYKDIYENILQKLFID